MPDTAEFEAHKRRATRERKARREAERLLEAKAAELYELNLSLEREVRSRTQELHEALEAAVSASKARSDFFARMSHEIRTPMNAVIGMTDYLLMEDHRPDVVQGLETIRSASRSLLSIINEILDFSKLEAGGMHAQVCEFRVGALLESVFELLVVTARQKSLDFSVDCCEVADCWVRGGEEELRRVLLNLTGNAIKFTEHGSVSVRARVVESSGSQLGVEFSVSDTGVGIPAKHLARVFEPFEQADGSPTRTHGGTGLGLAISSSLVELMGGTLSVQSAIGEGSRFGFVLHFEQVTPYSKLERTSMEQTNNEPLNTGGSLVLVVDDNPVNVMVAKRLLERRGHSVDTASSGRDAVAKISATKYDVVLMDVQMPEMSGLAATAQVRELKQHSDTTIVGFSAGSRPEERQLCADAGMQGYLTKPVQALELYETVERLSRKQASEATDTSDEDKLQQLIESPQTVERLGDDPELVELCIDAFLETSPNVQCDIEAARDNQDLTSLRAVAHLIKGGVLATLAPNVASVAAELERVARSGDETEAVRLSQSLQDKVARTSDVFRRYRNRERLACNGSR